MPEEPGIKNDEQVAVRHVCEYAHQTVSPLLVRVVWKSPIPLVMTTSGGNRTTGASRRKTGGCYRKSLFPSLFFQLCACVDR